jgi:queuine tRNA-ribosyltransferase
MSKLRSSWAIPIIFTLDQEWKFSNLLEGCMPSMAVFQSHIDGSKHLFTPEKAMDIQRVIGGDIIMAFDECPPYPSEYKYVMDSMDLTHRWLDRCFHQFNHTEPLYGYTQNLFPIVQGGTHKDLRKASCEYISAKDAVGNAIGGLSVGEP